MQYGFPLSLIHLTWYLWRYYDLRSIKYAYKYIYIMPKIKYSMNVYIAINVCMLGFIYNDNFYIALSIQYTCCSVTD